MMDITDGVRAACVAMAAALASFGGAPVALADEADTPPPLTAEMPVYELAPEGCEPFSLPGTYRLTDYPGRGVVGPNGEQPMQMAATYVFTGTAYEMDGYPPLTITGDYEVIEVDGARLHVRFVNTIFNGSPRDDRDVWLTFSDCGATLEMDRKTFSRVAD